MHNQQRNNKSSLYRTIILIFLLSFTCWYLSGFKGLDKVKEMLHITQKEEHAEFDKTPYLGTYYLESIDVKNDAEGTNTHYGLGDIYGNTFSSCILSRETLTIELRENSYTYTSRFSMVLEIYGEWIPGTNADTFAFYNSNGILVISAKIVDGTLTMTERESALGVGTVTIYTLKKA